MVDIPSRNTKTIGIISDRKPQGKLMTKMALIEKIANRLCGIDECDLTGAESGIVDYLEEAGYLRKRKGTEYWEFVAPKSFSLNKRKQRKS